MQTNSPLDKKLIRALWALGMVGVVSVLPAVPALVAAQKPVPTISILLIQLFATIQSGVLIFAAVLLGAFFSHRVKLASPVLQALVNKKPVLALLKPQLLPAIIGGVAGGGVIVLAANQFVAYLPADFLAATEKLSMPWYALLLYGGISEELLLRWGLMSFLVWFSFRVVQSDQTKVQNIHYIFGIVLSSVLFGMSHLPTVYALSSSVNTPLILYIVIVNASFGLISGALFWQFGLECAILAHMLAHATLLVLEKV